jgi:hypothetical protein
VHLVVLTIGMYIPNVTDILVSFLLLFLWLESYNCRYHFFWGKTVCHWVTCKRFSIRLNNHLFSGLLLGNFYQLILNHSFVSKRPETSYLKAWRQNPEEQLPHLGGCRNLKDPTFFFLTISFIFFFLHRLNTFSRAVFFFHFVCLCPVIDVFLRFLLSFTS